MLKFPNLKCCECWPEATFIKGKPQYFSPNHILPNPSGCIKPYQTIFLINIIWPLQRHQRLQRRWVLEWDRNWKYQKITTKNATWCWHEPTCQYHDQEEKRLVQNGFLHPASATGVTVLASSFCVCVCVCLSLRGERTNIQTWISACRSSGL